MSRNKTNRGIESWEIALLLLLLGGFIVLNYALVRFTHWIPRGDAADHLIKSIIAFRHLKAGAFPQFCWGDTFYPPLVYQVSALQYWLFPPGVLSGVLSQWPFWAILIFSVYGIGKFLFSRLTGFLAVFFILTCPLTMIWAYQYMLDFPAAAFNALAFYCLLKSDDFRNRFYALAFGLAMGLGMLVKWWVGFIFLPLLLFYFCRFYFGYLKNWLLRIFGLVILGSLFYGVCRLASVFNDVLYPDTASLFHFGLYWGITILEGAVIWLFMRGVFWLGEKLGQTKEEYRGQIFNLLSALTLMYMVCAWLYFNPYFALLNGSLTNFGGGGVMIIWPYAEYYPLKLWQMILGPVFLSFLIVGMLTVGFKLRGNQGRQLLVIALLSALVLMILVPNKQERFAFSWLALASPLAVFWFESLSWAGIVPGLILLLSGTFYVLCGWALPPDLLSRKVTLSRVLECGPLNFRLEPFQVNDEFYQKFFAPLPKRGERILIISNIPFPLADSVIRVYPYLYPVKVDVQEHDYLRDYQYVVYARVYQRESRQLYQLIKSMEHDRFADVDDYDFPVVSRYPMPQYGYDLLLCRVVKR